jgi:hypothetical protein
VPDNCKTLTLFRLRPECFPTECLHCRWDAEHTPNELAMLLICAPSKNVLSSHPELIAHGVKKLVDFTRALNLLSGE